MIKNLLIVSCVWGTILYFILSELQYDISYGRCFLSILLIKSLMHGIESYIKKDQIQKAVDKSIEEYNKQL